MEVFDSKIDIDKNLWVSILQDQELINENVIEILNVLGGFPNQKATATQIAKHLNKASHQSVTGIVVGFCQKIVKKYTTIEYPKRSKNTIRYWHIPFVGEDTPRGFTKGSFFWQLRSELYEALQEIEQVSVQMEPSDFPFEMEMYFEGQKKEIIVTVSKRDLQARQKCIDHFGAFCHVCGFNFRIVYGEEFKEKIVVHHILPLAEIGEEYRVDPIQDLVPVCPNCHLVIHSKQPAYTLQEVRELMEMKQRAGI